MSIIRGAAWAVGLGIVVGCGAGGSPMFEVEGTVKLNGQPLDKIHVEFWPRGDGPRSIGMTDGQGRFTLTSDDGKQKGALVGPHKIVLRDAGVLGERFLGRRGEGADMTKGKKPRIANRYGDPRQTPLERTVTAGNCVIALDVTP